MRNFLKTIAVLAILLLVSVAFVAKPSEKMATYTALEEGITFPENVQTIIDAKCMNCHKPDARNEKAREKLQWVKVPDMDLEQQAHLIGDLFEVLEEGKMPPPRMVERNPKLKLTDDETKTLLAWVEKEEKRIKGQN